jgi:hypothetical protein
MSNDLFLLLALRQELGLEEIHALRDRSVFAYHELHIPRYSGKNLLMGMTFTFFSYKSLLFKKRTKSSFFSRG